MRMKNTIPEALKDVDRAFRHLEFSIKLMCYIELDHIDREKFDTDITLCLERENVSFPADTFQSMDSLVRVARTNVGISFGITAIVLDAAFETASIKPRPESDVADDLLRTFVYMVRCAFAHNPALPCWEVRGSYQRNLDLKLEGENISIDLSRLHGKSFDYADIGGLANWYRIRRAAERLIDGAFKKTS